MSRTLLTVLCLLVLLRASLCAAPPDAEQRRIAEAFVAKSVAGRILYDDAGHVVKLALSLHEALRADKTAPMPAGVSDEEFRDILKLPRLEAIFLEKQPLSDASYALLAQLKHLKDVRIHYPTGATEPKAATGLPAVPATADFGVFINQLPGLRVLQFKHIFSIKGDGLAKIQPQPELEHLEIDTICAKASAVPFLQAARRLRNLQVHRTNWTDAELQEVFAALPELEVLELKPNRIAQDPIGGRSLLGLANCPKLRLVQLVGNWADLPYEGGLEVFAKLPALRQLNLGIKGVAPDSEAVQKLRSARPDLLLKIGDQILGGQPGQKAEGIDDGYDWGGNVTTHG